MLMRKKVGVIAIGIVVLIGTALTSKIIYAFDISGCVNSWWAKEFSWEKDGKEAFHFKNSCGVTVTVFFCATSHYRKTCNTGGRYYTHSTVIKPGDTDVIGWIEGQHSGVHWAVCRGNYGFGAGDFSDTPTGAYSCGAS